MFAPADKPWMVGGTVSNVANFTPGDEGSMRAVVGLHNPVSVAFEVVPDLRHYAEVKGSSPVGGEGWRVGCNARCHLSTETYHHARA